MNQINLLKQIESAFDTLLKREPKFTGSLTLQVNFQEGVAKDIIKTVERSRELISSTRAKLDN